MDLYDHQDQGNQPASHYERVVLGHEMNTFIQLVKMQAFNYMDQLEGWCTNNKASILIDLIFMIQPKTVVEIGVFGGKSLVPMAYALKATNGGIVYGIDPWDSQESVVGMDEVNYAWWNSLDHGKIMRSLQSKISEFDLDDHTLLIKSTSELAPPIYNIDILHIDGNHSEETSFLDVTKWVPLVRKGGLIILDDITWSINNYSTNAKSVKWLDENCIKLTEFHDVMNDWGIWIKK